MISVDVVVVGGGCVGAATALGLANLGIQVAVVDAQSSPVVLTEAQSPLLRVSAISAASEQYLRTLGVWDAMNLPRATAYTAMHVWDKAGFGSIDFDAGSVQATHLGHIIENDNMRHALHQALADHDNVTLLSDASVEQFDISAREALVNVAYQGKQTHVLAKLIVAADGAHSFIREQAALPLTFWDYHQSAIVATVRLSRAHQHTAQQIFLPSGPIALLPLWEDDLCSLVWSATPELADELMAMDSESFSKKLCAAFDGSQGAIQTLSERQCFPLRMRYARRWVEPRLALVGDAAHTIHPLAGLGMNLGYLDSASLVQTIQTTLSRQQDIGDLSGLRAYERWRKAEAQEYIVAMEGLKRLFSNDNQGIKLVRNLGLSIVNNLPLMKSQITRRAMGVSGTLPTLMQQ